MKKRKDTRITDEICLKVTVSVTADPEHFEAICSMIVRDANQHLMDCSGVGVDVGSYHYKSVNAVLQPNICREP